MDAGQDNTTQIVEDCLSDLAAGNSKALNQLLELTLERLKRLARTMFRDHPAIARWEDIDDVIQRGSLRLWKVLQAHHPDSAIEYYRLAAKVLRRELIDIARHYFGPHGLGTHHVTPNHPSGHDSNLPLANSTLNPASLQSWTEFHETVERLPLAQREVFDLLWYQGLPQKEAAKLLGTSERTLQRIWHQARLAVYKSLHDPAAE